MTRRRAPDAGSVTAELAVAMVAVGVILAALASVVAVGMAQVRVSDAASAGARLAARGETEGVVRSAAVRLAGDGAAVSVERGGEFTQVTVVRSVALLLPGRPTVRVDSRALGVTERGSDPGGLPGPVAGGPVAGGPEVGGPEAGGPEVGGPVAGGPVEAGSEASVGAVPVVRW